MDATWRRKCTINHLQTHSCHHCFSDENYQDILSELFPTTPHGYQPRRSLIACFFKMIEEHGTLADIVEMRMRVEQAESSIRHRLQIEEMDHEVERPDYEWN